MLYYYFIILSYIKSHKIATIKLNYIKTADIYICSKSLTQTPKQRKEPIQSFCRWHQASTHESDKIIISYHIIAIISLYVYFCDEGSGLGKYVHCRHST